MQLHQPDNFGFVLSILPQIPGVKPWLDIPEMPKPKPGAADENPFQGIVDMAKKQAGVEEPPPPPPPPQATFSQRPRKKGKKGKK